MSADWAGVGGTVGRPAQQAVGFVPGSRPRLPARFRGRQRHRRRRAVLSRVGSSARAKHPFSFATGNRPWRRRRLPARLGARQRRRRGRAVRPWVSSFTRAKQAVGLSPGSRPRHWSRHRDEGRHHSVAAHGAGQARQAVRGRRWLLLLQPPRRHRHRVWVCHADVQARNLAGSLSGRSHSYGRAHLGQRLRRHWGRKCWATHPVDRRSPGRRRAGALSHNVPRAVPRRWQCDTWRPRRSSGRELSVSGGGATGTTALPSPGPPPEVLPRPSRPEADAAVVCASIAQTAG